MILQTHHKKYQTIYREEWLTHHSYIQSFYDVSNERKMSEEKYKTLLEEHENLSKKLEDLKNKEKLEERKQIEFSEKIDELNQETDTLLDEIDKWQM